MAILWKNTHFGAYGVDQPSSSPNHGKIRFLKPLPHAGDKCSCARCDELRQDNGQARASINWPRDYPPKFYDLSPPEVEEEMPDHYYEPFNQAEEEIW